MLRNMLLSNYVIQIGYVKIMYYYSLNWLSTVKIAAYVGYYFE